MRRTIVLLFAAGCASAGAVEGSDSTPKQAAIFSDPSTGTLLAERPRAQAAALTASPQIVWVAVKKVYADMEIPVTVENQTTHQIGNPNFYRTRNIANQSLVDFVDCGSGMTGPKSATYRIYISLLADVLSDGKGGTKVQVTFVPIGQDITGASTDRIPCGSTGRFEQLFLDKVKIAVMR